MNTQTFIIPSETLLAMVNAPDGSKVERTGPTTGTERGKTDGVFIVISKETESKAMDRSVIDLDRPQEPREPQVPRDEPVPVDDTNPGDVPSPGKNPPPPPPPGS